MGIHCSYINLTTEERLACDIAHAPILWTQHTAPFQTCTSLQEKVKLAHTIGPLVQPSDIFRLQPLHTAQVQDAHHVLKNSFWHETLVLESSSWLFSEWPDKLHFHCRHGTAQKQVSQEIAIVFTLMQISTNIVPTLLIMQRNQVTPHLLPS
ncbi:hypothetical protein GQ44DRAFT_140649 [Phaeosphaeriaceae sp. PMI808]|nr:hypothetical protein GQ44DRAFT_140649 [Phaeosphaeriaceae sp. PMI808]